jgi:endoglycosylceramidase
LAIAAGCAGPAGTSPVDGSAGSAGSAGNALPAAPIGHRGRWLTDALGRVVLVHGVNMVDKAAPYDPASAGFSDADAAWLADNGLRVVRVGVLATGLMPTPGAVDAGYVARIAATVNDLASHQIFSLVDFHQDGYGPALGDDGFPAWMTTTASAGHSTVGFPGYYTADTAMQQAFDDFWHDAPGPDGLGLQADYATMFGALGAALGSQAYVLGYDLFNEPWPGTSWQPCEDPAGCPAQDVASLGTAYGKAVATIRAAGDDHLVFGEPFNLFNFGGIATSIPLPGGDPNSGLSFHAYPAAATDATNVVAEATSWSDGTGGALLASEWGAVTDADTLTTLTATLDEAMLPWIFWSYCCELVTSLGGAPTPADLVPTSAAILLQPYPLVVAGTPTSYGGDPALQTLAFSWSTTRVGGGALPPGTPTTFEVPAMTYPLGYTATVTGGAVTSAPCATLLTVEAAPGASDVTVQIVPGAACRPAM